MIVCPHCSAKLVAFTKRHKCKDGRITETKKYRCEQKQRTHTAPCITERKIEAYLLEHVSTELQKRIYDVKESYKNVHLKKNKTIALKTEMERLNILFQKGRITMDYYDEQYTRLEKELSSSEQQDIVNLESYKNIEKILSGDWHKFYDELDYTHRKAFWKRIIKEIYVDSETHKISGFEFLVCGCGK
jgi:hypothetical protein